MKMIRHILVPYKDLKLVGVLHSHHQRSNKLVLFLHSFGTYKEEIGYLYSYIAENIRNESIMIDFYGCGDSPGELSEVSYSGMVDEARTVLRHLRDLYPSYEISVISKGLAIPIAFYLSNEITLKNIICIGNIDNLSLPEIPIDILNEWKARGSIEYGILLSSVRESVRVKLKKWISQIGYLNGADLISYHLVQELKEELISSKIISQSVCRVVWFIEKNSKLKYSKRLLELDLYHINMEIRNPDYIAPDSINEIVLKIREIL
jgi:hypothetical protein